MRLWRLVAVTTSRQYCDYARSEKGDGEAWRELHYEHVLGTLQRRIADDAELDARAWASLAFGRKSTKWSGQMVRNFIARGLI